jgi:hypothetical protein
MASLQGKSCRESTAATSGCESAGHTGGEFSRRSGARPEERQRFRVNLSIPRGTARRRVTRLRACGVVLFCTMTAPSDAGQAAMPRPVPVAKAAAPKPVRIPGTDYDVAIGTSATTGFRMQPPTALLRAIVAWLAREFGLPRSDVHPAIRFEPPARIATFRFTGVASDRPQDLAALPSGRRETVAVYDPLTQTILLPERWSGSTPAELSILVHEMVHHLQNVAGLRYECAQASETLAYAAQDKWLRLFKRSLATDFEIDDFTLLVTSRCAY